MATAENAKLEYEGGQTAVPISLLTDSGDRTTFESSDMLWSQRSGFAPEITPNGLLTGGAISTATSGSDDVIDVAALTCNLNGVDTSVTSTADVSVTRGATNVARITSITISSGGSIAAIAGTSSTDTTFSETRGAAGGPPFIPVDAIEIGQVRTTTSAAAAVTDDEIFQTVGLHRERADFPQYNIDYSNGNITFLTALTQDHTGGLPKRVYAHYHTPIFAEVSLASDFVPPENTHAINSTQIYRTTIGSSTSTLNQGSFTAYLQNGVSDTLVTLKDESLWFRFYPDQYAARYLLTHGKLGIARTFPADNEIQAACTVSATEAAIEVG